MSKPTSNIGQKGVASIRLKGRRVDDLPLGQGNQAKEQMADAIECERLNAIAEVNARYPHQRVDYLVARMDECEKNKNRMRKFISDCMEKINEYRGLITMSRHREALLAHAETEEQRRQVNKDFPPYDADEMNRQIGQFEVSIKRAEKVIEDEDASIREMAELVSRCRERDRELAKLGARADGS